MNDAWRTLVSFGVPDGPVRPVCSDPIVSEQVRPALREVMSSELDAHHSELLLAWLRAWQHHWPQSFSQTLGDEGAQATSRLTAQVRDAGRYLKFRRIAIANLSSRL